MLSRFATMRRAPRGRLTRPLAAVSALLVTTAMVLVGAASPARPASAIAFAPPASAIAFARPASAIDDAGVSDLRRGLAEDAAVGDQLSASDVQTIIAQAVGRAQRLGVAATIAVTGREGDVLGVFVMNGARSDILIGSTQAVDPDGLEQQTLPLGAAAAAVSKAGTAA